MPLFLSSLSSFMTVTGADREQNKQVYKQVVVTGACAAVFPAWELFVPFYISLIKSLVSLLR